METDDGFREIVKAEMQVLFEQLATFKKAHSEGRIGDAELGELIDRLRKDWERRQSISCNLPFERPPGEHS